MVAIKVYQRDSYVKEDGTSAIYCTFYAGRRKIRIPTGVSVAPIDFDAEKGRVLNTVKKHRDYNLIIADTLSQIHNIFVRFKLEQRPLTQEAFMREFSNPTSYVDFWDFMEKELHSRKGMIALNTGFAHQSILNKLKPHYLGLQFMDLNVDCIMEMQKTLKRELKNNNNTIHKTLTTIKSYINIAKRKRLIKDNPFDFIKIKRQKGHILFLNEAELRILIDHYKRKRLDANLHEVLRYYLFSCGTGLRISDVKQFCMEQIAGDMIIMNPHKTLNTSHEKVTIPLTKFTKQLIKDAAPHRVKGIVFKTYADPVTNRMLKTIASDCGINKPLSFHSARHTFATLFLEKTDDLATLQKLLGHSDIKQTMIYVHLSEVKKVDQMEKCWADF
jgi:integrase